MQGRQKLLLSVMVWGLVLFYGTTVATALTPQEIKIAKGSTVYLMFKDSKGNSWTGSGFVVRDGQIATNYHVVENMSIGVAQLGEKEDMYRVERVLATDKKCDLAIVKVTGIDVPALPLGDSDVVQEIDKVYVVGSPKGLRNTISAGIISAIRPEGIPPLRCKLLQMDASVSPGSSGGPVLNDSGEVIGISVIGSTGDTQNLNFAVAVNHLKALMPTPPVKPKVDPPFARPTVKHESPSSISVGETIPLTLDLIGSKAAQQVTIHYKTYDRNRNELEQSNQNMRLLPQQSTASTWTYQMSLPSQKDVGSLEYYIAVQYDNHRLLRDPSDRNRHYRISIIDDKPPTISVLYPPDDAKFGANQEITFKAKVTDNMAVKDVQIHTAWFNSQQSQKLTAKGSSDIYTIDITLQNIVSLRYYLTATDEEGNEGRSETRHLDIKIISVPGIERGIWLYEQARYSEAIETLSAAIREIKDSEPRASERRAEACLYLGGSKRGIGEGNDKVREQFQESIRHYPDQELPPRLGKDHPIFAELIEEVRKELTGELTVISLLPETEIWIEGNHIDRRMLGTGIVSSRLLTDDYIVEGIYEGGSKKRTVTIEPDHHKVLDLGIPPAVAHDSPPRMSVGEIIPLTVNLISTKSPQQVKINYKSYDRDKDELEQSNQEMGLWAQRSAPSTEIYKVDLPSQNRVGSIAYYIEIGYENHGIFRHPTDQNDHHQISIVDEETPIAIVQREPDSQGGKKQEGGNGPGTTENGGVVGGDDGETGENRSKPYQGIWASVAADTSSTSDGLGGNTFSLAYLDEGKTLPTLGAQLDFFLDRTNVSGRVQWGPHALKNSNIAFTLLGGIAAYEDSPRSTHTTPIFGAGLKLYPRDKVVIDATSSIKFRSDYDTTDLYHYEIGARFYIHRDLSLRVGYGKLYLGNQDITTIQVGFGYTF